MKKKQFLPFDVDFTKIERSLEYGEQAIERLCSHLYTHDNFMIKLTKDIGFIANEVVARDRKHWRMWPKEHSNEEIEKTRQLEQKLLGILRECYDDSGEMAYELALNGSMERMIEEKRSTYNSLVQSLLPGTPRTDSGKEFAYRYQIIDRDLDILKDLVAFIRGEPFSDFA